MRVHESGSSSPVMLQCLLLISGRINGGQAAITQSRFMALLKAPPVMIVHFLGSGPLLNYVHRARFYRYRVQGHVSRMTRLGQRTMGILPIYTALMKMFFCDVLG